MRTEEMIILNVTFKCIYFLNAEIKLEVFDNLIFFLKS